MTDDIRDFCEFCGKKYDGKRPKIRTLDIEAEVRIRLTTSGLKYALKEFYVICHPCAIIAEEALSPENIAKTLGIKRLDESVKP